MLDEKLLKKAVSQGYPTDYDLPLFRSKYVENLIPFHGSDYMSVKLKGVFCMGTSCACNEYCKKYSQDPEKVCSHCYAEGTLTRYKDTGKNAAYNTQILSSRELKDYEIPIIKPTAEIVRFEPFGDLNNVVQAVNYANIIWANPNVRFGWWTKNTELVKLAYRWTGKPKNVQMVQSSFYLNKECELEDYMDKSFTVYTLDWLLENVEDIDRFINCGAKSCLGCQHCYKKNKISAIREMEKSDMRRWQAMKRKAAKK